MVVLPNDHPLAEVKNMRLADLLASPMVLMDRDSSVRRIVDAACASIGRMAEPAFEAAYMSTAIGLVRAGLGATLLPSSAAELRATSDLTIRDLDTPRIERELGVLKQRRRAYSPAAEAFVAVLTTLARDGFGATSGKKPSRGRMKQRKKHANDVDRA
jgi:DNA-binding transcriptional LysR family regulator